MTNMTQRTNELVRQQPLLVAGIAFVVGLLIGWLAIGWGVWPVEWTDASIGDLRATDKHDYVRLVAAEYALELSSEKAAQRLAALGPSANQVISDTLTTSQGQDAVRVAQLRQVLEIRGGLPSDTGGGEAPSAMDRFRLPLLACSLLVVFGLGAAGVWYLWNTGTFKRTVQARQAAMTGGGRSQAPAETREFDAGPAAPTPTGAPPVAQFMTTYVLGDDLYDDSFSIDAPDGSFLGECGMGISETIGVGDPKKVMAFEVWLFDKNDIRTVTKVLMSEHAYKDEALRSRLAAKGEPVQVQSGDVVTMETASLVVTARVVDMAYGGGALPTNSFFERLTIELAAYTKNQVSQPASTPAS